ncbi:MAG TPA: S26 family signal peptidase, partial [Planctomycetaceae bacterium]|nr:S26 family signal peptidase [Planctomycetaceae bacterium]
FAAGSVRRGQLPDAPGSPTEPEQWVGDLTVNCALEVLSAEGEVTFELVEGRRLYHCRIDLATGLGTFHYTPEAGDEEDEWQPAGEPFETGMNKPGVYQVSFANVDDRLCFWVGDRLMKSLEFEEGSKFEPPPPPVAETERDRHPVAIGARLAKVRLAHLRIERDIFYRSEVGGSILPPDKTFDLKNDPDDDSKDEFLMLGDNSPRSNDSRGWQKSHAVPRHLLIGKAFFVYWPHGVPFLNDGRGYAIAKYYEEKTNGPPIPKFSVPFYPQIGRMHRIR